jgi:2-haloacid dehalogenase
LKANREGAMQAEGDSRPRPQAFTAAAPPKAVLFDVYGTLFDVHSVAGVAEAHFPGHGAALAQVWRLKQVDYTRLCSMSGRYRPFSEVTEAALEAAAAGLGVDLTDDARQQILLAYGQLAPYPDCDAVLRRLESMGLPLGVLSNGEPEQLDQLIASAGWDDLLPVRISTHEASCYKTDPRAYALGPAHLGLPAQDILFVSANGWDAMGATWYGLRVFWLNREQVAAEAIGPALGEEGRVLEDLLRLFD